LKRVKKRLQARFATCAVGGYAKWVLRVPLQSGVCLVCNCDERRVAANECL
jgi:hypothetical protein